MLGDKSMSLIPKIFGGEGVQKPSDPIIDCCLSFAQQFHITLTDEEWNHVLRNRDKLAESPLGGAYVHKDIFHALCFLCLFDGLFEAGLELLSINDIHQAKNSLEKAKNFFPWPTVLYSLGLAYTRSGEVDAATKIWNKAIEDFESRPSLLSDIVPGTLPDRSNFITMTTKRIDITGSASLGFTNIEELKVNISKKIQELRNKKLS
jgi:tetratricopeptide (TPR) repeat protein